MTDYTVTQGCGGGISNGSDSDDTGGGSGTIVVVVVLMVVVAMLSIHKSCREGAETLLFIMSRCHVGCGCYNCGYGR